MNDIKIIEKALREEDTYRDIQEHIVVGHLQDFNKLLDKLISNALVLKEIKFCDECYEQGRLKAQQEILKIIEKMQENDVGTKGYYRKIEAEELKKRIKGEALK